jgi:hypothetical protein
LTVGVLWFDGFDYYDSTDLPLSARYSFVANAFDNDSAGRFGGRCLSTGSGITCRMTHPIPAQSALSFGMAIKISSAGSSDRATVSLLKADGTVMCILWIRGSDKNLVLCRGQFGVSSNVLAETTTGLSDGVWHYIGVEFVRDGSAGEVRLYLDGVLEDSVTGVNTGSNDIELMQLEAFSTNAVFMDDYYVVSGATWLGEQRVEYLPDSADTAQKDWTPDTGSDNYARVNDVPMDGDGSYVSASTIGDRDLYEIDPLSSTPDSIAAVQVVVAGRKDDVTTRTIAPVLVSGATTDVGDDIGMASGYKVGVQLYDLDPDGSVAWEAAAVNALNVGMEVTA